MTGFNLVTDASANNTIRSLQRSQSDMSASLNRLSNGYRVLTAKDDVAANAIAVKLGSIVEGYAQAILNTSQGKSMLETAEGGLNQMSKAVTRMKALCIQASSTNLGKSDKAKVNSEFQQLVNEIDRIAKSTNFNGKTLLSGQATVAANTNAVTGALLGSGTGAGNGIAALTFDDGIEDSPFSLSYISTGTDIGNLTMTNLETGHAETIRLNQGAITTGTESYRFTASGATITLNSNFTKGSTGNFGNNVGITNTAAITGGAGVITANTVGKNDNIKITGSTGSISGLNGAGQIVASTLGTANAVTLTLDGGSGLGDDFVGTVDLSTTGVKTATLQRTIAATATTAARTDSITISIPVTTAFDGTETAFTIDLLSAKNTYFTQTSTNDVADFGFQVGVTTAPTDQITLSLASVTAKNLELVGLDLINDPNGASGKVSTALEIITDRRSTVGAAINRLTVAASNLTVSKENFEAARATLVELDASEEMSNYVGKQILVQTGIAMLSKNNQAREFILQLLR